MFRFLTRLAELAASPKTPPFVRFIFLFVIVASCVAILVFSIKMTVPAGEVIEVATRGTRG